MPVTLFVNGTLMRGLAPHGNLDGAEFPGAVRTAPRYRLYLVDGRWPALVAAEPGVEIGCELYEAPEPLLSDLARAEPPGWHRRPLELADGRVVEAFVGDAELVGRGVDLSAYGSWREYVRSSGYQTTA
jgi:gamma-glutamylcyclotransferase (GGCT)/AIG2-like uncharacterized protein YtfP